MHSTISRTVRGSPPTLIGDILAACFPHQLKKHQMLIGIINQHPELVEDLNDQITGVWNAVMGTPTGNNTVTPHNYLREFLDALPPEIREFFDGLPAEAKGPFRMASGYWAPGEMTHEGLLVGNLLVALAQAGQYAEAQTLALDYSRDPVTVVARLGGTVDSVIASEGLDEEAGLVRSDLERLLDRAAEQRAERIERVSEIEPGPEQERLFGEWLEVRRAEVEARLAQESGVSEEERARLEGERRELSVAASMVGVATGLAEGDSAEGQAVRDAAEALHSLLSQLDEPVEIPALDGRIGRLEEEMTQHQEAMQNAESVVERAEQWVMFTIKRMRYLMLQRIHSEVPITARDALVELLVPEREPAEGESDLNAAVRTEMERRFWGEAIRTFLRLDAE